jgi:cyclase
MDVKGLNLVKTVQLEGLRQVGNPADFARNYYANGADEVIYLDIVASLYRRNNLTEIVDSTTSDIFIPVTAGGGIRSVDDCSALLKSGADKIAINTFAVEQPNILGDISEKLGSQALVLSIEAKCIATGKYEIYTDCGRESTGVDVVDWVKQCSEFGVGEILITSIDREGTRLGFDNDLIGLVAENCNVPIIASGGFGKMSDVKTAVDAGADAVAIADGFHFNRFQIREVKEKLLGLGYEVRL